MKGAQDILKGDRVTTIASEDGSCCRRVAIISEILVESEKGVGFKGLKPGRRESTKIRPRL